MLPQSCIRPGALASPSCSPRWRLADAHRGRSIRPLTHVDNKTGYRVETRPPRPTDDSTVIVLAFSGGGTRAAAFSYGVLEELNRIEIDIPGGRSAPHRPGRRDHRRLRRQLHCARLRPLRRQALRRLRAAVPEARRAGRARFARAFSARLARAGLRGIRALRACRAALRRDPVRRRDVRRPQPEGGSVHPRHGDRHLDRIAPRVRADRLRPHLLRPRPVPAFARCGRLVGRPAGAVAGDAQQLRRPVRLQVRELDPRDRGFRDGVAAGRPRGEALSRDEDVRGQCEPALHPPGRRRRVRQPRHARAAGSAGKRRGRPPAEIPRRA